MAIKNEVIRERIHRCIDQCWREWAKHYEVGPGSISEPLIASIRASIDEIFQLKRKPKVHAVVSKSLLKPGQEYVTLCDVTFHHYKTGDGMTAGGTDIKAIIIDPPRYPLVNSPITCHNCTRIHQEQVEALRKDQKS